MNSHFFASGVKPLFSEIWSKRTVGLLVPPRLSLWLCYVTEVTSYASDSSCEPAGTENSAVCVSCRNFQVWSCPFLSYFKGEVILLVQIA